MKKPKLSDIVGIINKKFPFALAEDWDNSGLQIGDPQKTIHRIMVALDPLPAVVESAIQQQADLLITHHPLIFSPLRQIITSNTTGSILLQAATSNLSILSMHTNYDVADDGLNDHLASLLQISKTSPLRVSSRPELMKLVVFVPLEQLESVRSALFAHAALIGNYKDCSFSSPGEGTFWPLEGADPSIGSVGKLEKVPEQRLELLLYREQLPRAIKTLLAVHPYEEPAFDCYPLLNDAPAAGLGRVGLLDKPIQVSDFADLVRQKLSCPTVRVVGNLQRTIQKIALCSGSGASLLKDAVRVGADLLLTGDLKYHEAREAEAQGIVILDAGHFGTEIIMVAAVRNFLLNSLAQQGLCCEVVAANCEQDPFQTVSQ